MNNLRRIDAESHTGPDWDDLRSKLGDKTSGYALFMDREAVIPAHGKISSKSRYFFCRTGPRPPGMDEWYETNEHGEIKEILYEAAETGGWEALYEEHGATPDGQPWRADVLCRREVAGREITVVFEAQKSHQLRHRYIQRGAKYAQSYIHNVWFRCFRSTGKKRREAPEPIVEPGLTVLPLRITDREDTREYSFFYDVYPLDKAAAEKPRWGDTSLARFAVQLLREVALRSAPNPREAVAILVPCTCTRCGWRGKQVKGVALSNTYGCRQRTPIPAASASDRQALANLQSAGIARLGWKWQRAAEGFEGYSTCPEPGCRGQLADRDSQNGPDGETRVPLKLHFSSPELDALLGGPLTRLVNITHQELALPIHLDPAATLAARRRLRVAREAFNTAATGCHAAKIVVETKETRLNRLRKQLYEHGQTSAGWERQGASDWQRERTREARESDERSRRGVHIARNGLHEAEAAIPRIVRRLATLFPSVKRARETLRKAEADAVLADEALRGRTAWLNSAEAVENLEAVKKAVRARWESRREELQAEEAAAKAEARAASAGYTATLETWGEAQTRRALAEADPDLGGP